MRDKKLIKDQDIAKLSNLLREHLINSDTIIIRGTLGANREKGRDLDRKSKPWLPRIPKKDGYIAYNLKTNVASFYDLKDRNLRTFMSISKPNDRTDIQQNHN